ncbi:hypothetical protein D3C73_1108960 [compost metagenome]
MAIDQLRVKCFETLVVNLEFACGRQPHVVVHHIGPACQRLDDGLGLRITQLQRDPQFAPLGTTENSLQTAHGVTLRGFDFNDLGAQVRQQHAGKRPGQVGAQIQDFQAMQRWQWSGTPLVPLHWEQCISARQYCVPFTNQWCTAADSRR